MASEQFTIEVTQHDIAACPVWRMYDDLANAYPKPSGVGVVLSTTTRTHKGTVTVTCPASEVKDVLAIMAAVVERYYPC